MGLPDWGTAVGAIVNKVTQFIKGPVEGAKVKREKLLNERSILLSKDFSDANSRRIAAVDDELQKLNIIISNAAKDS